MIKNKAIYKYLVVCSFVVYFLLSGCLTTPQKTSAEHQQSLGSTQEREMTLGVVQKEIRVGMSQADVASALGSPNIVTKDSEGNETWIYDKIATEASYSYSGQAESGSAGAGLGALVGKALLLGGVGYSKAGAVGAGASATTQKTLTVVIKYDKKGLVKDLSYHTSKF